MNHGKYVVFLGCGHEVVCDWSVDREIPDMVDCPKCFKRFKAIHDAEFE